jgi:RHS repeat-associated protein
MKYGAADGLRQKFTSKQRDTESGLDYFGARYYSGPHARFTGVDPLMVERASRNATDMEPICLCVNNPLVIIDPNGEGWVQIGIYGGWDEGINSQEDINRARRYRGTGETDKGQRFTNNAKVGLGTKKMLGTIQGSVAKAAIRAISTIGEDVEIKMDLVSYYISSLAR